MLSKIVRRVVGSPSWKGSRAAFREASALPLPPNYSLSTKKCELSRNPYSTTATAAFGHNSTDSTLDKSDPSFRFQTAGASSSTTTVRHLFTHAIDDDDDDHEEESSKTAPSEDGTSISYSVQVSENGQQICVTAQREDDDSATSTNSTSWTLAAPLLWVNDPQFIHPSSGQRIRTLGQYTRDTAIRCGRVIGADDTGTTIVHPPPLPGSFHPRGGIYHSSDCHHDKVSETTTRELLEIEWNTGEISVFDIAWLTNHANLGRMGTATSLEAFEAEQEPRTTPSENVRARVALPSPTTNETTRITPDIAIRAIDSNTTDVAMSIPTLEYRDVMDHEEALFHALQGIYEYGAILVRKAPVLIENDHILTGSLFQTEQESVVGNLGKKFSGGALSHGSLYGDVFHVQSKTDAENIAYTNVGLPPHQDLTYYESKPFLQLLHCVSNGSIVGGESVLVDAMAAAEELRRLAPDIFDVLCRTEATFLKERAGADMVSPKPHIVTDPSLGHVVGINWSPPFEGPLQLSPHIPVEDYCRAYQALECMLNDRFSVGREDFQSLLSNDLEKELKEYAKCFTWEYALQRGDILVFNNQRMLHGRREFTAVGNGRRHLIGCYTDAMDTTSRYRQLLRERGGTGGGGYGKRNPGNGCRWM